MQKDNRLIRETKALEDKYSRELILHYATELAERKEGVKLFLRYYNGETIREMAGCNGYNAWLLVSRCASGAAALNRYISSIEVNANTLLSDIVTGSVILDYFNSINVRTVGDFRNYVLDGGSLKFSNCQYNSTHINQLRSC